MPTQDYVQSPLMPLPALLGGPCRAPHPVGVLSLGTTASSRPGRKVRANGSPLRDGADPHLMLGEKIRALQQHTWVSEQPQVRMRDSWWEGWLKKGVSFSITFGTAFPMHPKNENWTFNVIKNLLAPRWGLPVVPLQPGGHEGSSWQHCPAP